VVDANPSGSWTKLGTSGPLNYDESGVSIEQGQEIAKWRGLGAAESIKAFRVSADTIIKFLLADMTLEQYAYALNGNAVTTVAASSGVAGNKSISLSRSLLVSSYALLARGASSHGDFVGQFEFYNVIHVGKPNPVFVKDKPAMLDMTFEALRDTTLGVGTLRMQTAAAS